MTETNTNPGPATSAGTTQMLRTYQAWANRMAEYIRQAAAVVESLYSEQDQIIDQLRAALARNHSLRHADFDGIFALLLARRNRQRAPLAQLAQHYYADRRALLEDLRDMFKCNVTRAQELWPSLKCKLLDEQADGTRRAVAVLQRVHVEQQELSTALTGLLTRGKRVRIDDVKTVANRLANRDAGHSAELAELLAGCETAARQAGEKWQKLAG